PRVIRRDADSDAAEFLFRGRQASRERRPRRSAVGGMKEAVSGTAERVSVLPGRLSRRPEHCVDVLRIGRIKGQIDGSSVFILIEDLLPGASAVQRAKDSSLWVGTIRMSECGDEDTIGVLWVDQDCRNLPSVGEAEVAPGAAAVDGLVDAVSHR